MGKEKWVDIKGYEEFYSINSCGEIFDKRKKCIKSTFLTRDRYKTIVLFNDDKKYKQYLVHRLVAINFISNPQNKPHVHHKDDNKTNNSEDNLQWVTPKEHGSLMSDASKEKLKKTYRKNKAKREDVHRIAHQTVL